MPPTVVDHIRCGRCVAYLGSGASAGHYSNWRNAVQAICEHCGVSSELPDSPSADQLLDAAQAAKDLDPEGYRAQVGEQFGTYPNSTRNLYRDILDCGFHAFVTTNFDSLLAREAARNGIGVDALPTLDRIRLSKRVHYLHGLADKEIGDKNSPVILARSEFDQWYQNTTALGAFVYPMIVNDPICFIGCTLREPALRRLFDAAKEEQLHRMTLSRESVTDLPRRIIFLPMDPDGGASAESEVALRVDETERAYSELGVQIVWYPTPGGDHSALDRAFARLAGVPAPTVNHGWSQGGGS